MPVLDIPQMLSLPGYISPLVTKEKIIREARVFVEYLKAHDLLRSRNPLPQHVDENFVLYEDDLSELGKQFCAKGLQLWDKYLEDLTIHGLDDAPKTTILDNHLVDILAGHE